MPDAQVAPGVPTKHLRWAGKAIAEYRPDVIHVMGDWFDMPSLSTHDAPGSKAKRLANIRRDIDCGNEAFEAFRAPWARKGYTPECHFYFGNHEDRITRYVESTPEFEGLLSLDLLETPGFQRHAFLHVRECDGIAYSHYFYSLQSGRPIGGSIPNRLHKIGRSFVAGHEQSLQYATVDYPGFRRHGLVVGSFYLHDPDYRGPQATTDWRGIVILNEVKNGDFDIMPISMGYLRRKFG